jgi:hypothetical protein
MAQLRDVELDDRETRDPAVKRVLFVVDVALQPEILLSIIAWIILGRIAGFIASKIVNRTGEGVVLDVLLGIGGAVVGGCPSTSSE